jgi:hypothetical protein
MILGWQKLQGEELSSAWTALEEWVWWLRSTYPSTREAIVDCWPAHSDMVNELTALCVWWEEINDTLVDEVADPDADDRAAVSEEATGRSAVAWHEALHHAVQRWKVTSKCSAAECVTEKRNEDLAADWRKRHARTRRLVAQNDGATALLGDPPPAENAAV